MKRDGLFTGLLLLGIGVLFLLDNFHLINFHWSNIINLWPLFLIIPGINLIFQHDRSTAVSIIKIAVVIIVFALVFYRGTRPADGIFNGHRYGYSIFDDDSKDDDDDNNDNVKISKVESTNSYNEPYNGNVKNAILNIRGGGASYTLGDTTASLFSAVTHVHSQRFLFSTTQSDSGKVINFTTKNGSNIHWGDDDDTGNQAAIKLNPNPVWDMDIAAGASTLKFDLSKFKVKNIRLKGGAASVDLKLGQPVGNMTVDVATGVSEVNISVPNGAACQILSKTGLSSKSYDGFDDKGNNRFETPGFDGSPNKIYLNLKGGVSDFKVNKY